MDAVAVLRPSVRAGERHSPTIVAADVAGTGVTVTYRVPGADGSEWPVLRVSVDEIEDELPPISQEARGIEDEGRLTVPVELRPGRRIAVISSVFYEDGTRVHLNEEQLVSPADAPGRVHVSPLKWVRHACRVGREAGGFASGRCPQMKAHLRAVAERRAEG